MRHPFGAIGDTVTDWLRTRAELGRDAQVSGMANVLVALISIVPETRIERAPVP